MKKDLWVLIPFEFIRNKSHFNNIVENEKQTPIEMEKNIQLLVINVTWSIFSILIVLKFLVEIF